MFATKSNSPYSGTIIYISQPLPRDEAFPKRQPSSHWQLLAPFAVLGAQAQSCEGFANLYKCNETSHFSKKRRLIGLAPLITSERKPACKGPRLKAKPSKSCQQFFKNKGGRSLPSVPCNGRLTNSSQAIAMLIVLSYTVLYMILEAPISHFAASCYHIKSLAHLQLLQTVAL